VSAKCSSTRFQTFLTRRASARWPCATAARYRRLASVDLALLLLGRQVLHQLNQGTAPLMASLCFNSEPASVKCLGLASVTLLCSVCPCMLLFNACKRCMPIIWLIHINYIRVLASQLNNAHHWCHNQSQGKEMQTTRVVASTATFRNTTGPKNCCARAHRKGPKTYRLLRGVIPYFIERRLTPISSCSAPLQVAPIAIHLIKSASTCCPVHCPARVFAFMRHAHLPCPRDKQVALNVLPDINRM